MRCYILLYLEFCHSSVPRDCINASKTKQCTASIALHGREPVASDQAAFAAPLPPRPPPRADPAKALADKDAQRRWILQYAQDEPSSGEDGSQV